MGSEDQWTEAGPRLVQAVLLERQFDSITGPQQDVGFGRFGQIGTGFADDGVQTTHVQRCQTAVGELRSQAFHQIRMRDRVEVSFEIGIDHIDVAGLQEVVDAT